MKVIIDERERELYEKCYSIVNTEGNVTYIQLSKEVLPLGDVSIMTDEDKPVLLIERKTFSDLLSSIKDGRYEEQSYRLSNSKEYFMHSIIYLIEGMFSNVKSLSEKKIIYSTMTSLSYFKGFSVLKSSTVRESAELIIWMANKIDRDMMKGKTPYYLNQIGGYRNHISGRSSAVPHTPTSVIAPTVIEGLSNTETTTETTTPDIAIPTPTVTNEGPSTEPTEVTEANYCSVVRKVKRENITPQNIGEIILCQIPGIHSATAISIMKSFRNFPHFMEELHKNPNVLDNLSCVLSNGKNRKISKTSIQNIKQYLLETPPASIPA